MSITSQQLADFLRENATINNCIVCGKNKWIVPSMSGQLSDLADVGGIPLAKEDGSIDFPSRGATVNFVVCSHCGFIQMHSAPIIEKKIREGDKNNG